MNGMNGMIEAKKFKKRPVVIEAMQLIGAAGDTAQVLDWLAANRYPMLVGDYTKPETLRYHDQVPEDDSRPDKGLYIDPATGDLMIRTLEGDMRATLGDWVIRGVQGEFYPIKDAIFRETYGPEDAAFEAALPHIEKEIRAQVAADIWEYWDACGDLIDDRDSARQAIDAIAAQIAKGTDND